MCKSIKIFDYQDGDIFEEWSTPKKIKGDVASQKGNRNDGIITASGRKITQSTGIKPPLL